jgi:HEAT repeat protein
MFDQGYVRTRVQAIKSGTEAARRDAILALKPHERAEWNGISNDLVRQATEALRHQLPRGHENGAKPPLYRHEVATILGNIGPRAEAAVPQLVDLLADGIPDGIREAAAVALGKIGKESRSAVEPLIAILVSNCRIGLADRVARALGDIGCADHRVKTALTNLWLFPIHSHSNQMQIAIALCKLRIEARGLHRFLAATLTSGRDTSLRKAAIEALSCCNRNDLDVVPALTAALYDEDEDVRKLAEEALTQMRLNRPRAIQICAQQLKDSAHAETALRKSGQAAVAALIEALDSKDPLAREKASRTLGAIGEAAVEAAPALAEVLDDKQLQVRLAAAKGLWNISKNGDAVVPVLADILAGKVFPNPEQPDARRSFFQSVIEALCRIGPAAKGAIPVLTRRTKDENRLIRESAQRALREIGPPLPKKVRV